MTSSAFLTEIGHYIYVVAATLVLYDHLLTLDREVHYMWPRGISRASIMFFKLRYLAAVVACLVSILKLPSFVTTTSSGCKSLILSEVMVDAVVFSVSAVFSGIRVYVLCPSNVWLAGIVAGIALANPAVAMYSYAQAIQSSLNPNVLLGEDTCQYDFTAQVHLNQGIIAARACAVLADVIVLLVTWSRTWPSSENRGIRTLSSVLFRDGTTYFVVLVVANLVSIFLLSNSEIPISITNCIGASTVVFTCRFMLDLHEANAKLSGDASQSSTAGSQDTTSPLQDGTLRFRSDSTLGSDSLDREPTRTSSPHDHINGLSEGALPPEQEVTSCGTRGFD